MTKHAIHRRAVWLRDSLDGWHLAAGYTTCNRQAGCVMSFGRKIWPVLFVLAVTATTVGAPAFAQQQQKPNILVIMAGDIGYWNISAYNRGIMGYRKLAVGNARTPRHQ
jgi:hypothetical protein